MPIEVSVIIVNFNTHKLVFDAVNSFIEKNKNMIYEIIIVDNSPSIEETKQLENYFKNFLAVSIIRTGENLGFGRANNIGANKAKGEYLYFLNEDTIQINNACEELLKSIKFDNSIACVTSNLYKANLKPTSSYGFRPVSIKELRRSCSIFRAIKAKIKIGKESFNYSNQVKEIYGFPICASTMIRKSDFFLIGGFDKDIFLYCEDSLLGYQITNKLHKKMLSVPSSKVIHLEGGADLFKQTSLFKARAVINGNRIFYQKTLGDKAAIKALKIKRRFHRICRFLYALCFKRENVQSQTNYLIAIKEELKQVIK